MIKRLQDISFRVSRYFRPLEAWHCGGMDDGEQCLLGPDKNGHCRAIEDCAPEQEDKTWVCTRSELLGGKCKAGPSAHGGCGRKRPPCTPVRSVRSRRSRFVWLAAAAALAATILIISVDHWQGPTNAGELSKHHAAFGEQQCDACHSSVDLPRSTWIKRAFAATPDHGGFNDDQLCISCHKLGEVSSAVHSLSADALGRLSLAAQSRQAERPAGQGSSLLLSAAKILRSDDAKEPNCSVCHQEHKGSEADISVVSDQQCAVCHTDAFASFDDHVEFTQYPADKRTAIIFSHNSHLNKHFSDPELISLAPSACVDCHVKDAVGRKMEVRGFAATCSACHVEQITGESRAGEKGFAMLSVPGIDLETLVARGVDIGSWPEYSDAEFTPLNYLLVAAINPKIAPQLDNFKKLDLFDLTEASDQELRLVYDVIWSLKQVFFEMQRGGARTVSRRLAKVLPTQTGTEAEIFGLLSPAVMDTVVAQAFPALDEEVLRWLQQSEPVFQVTAVAPEVKQPQQAPPTDSSQSQTASEDDDWLSGALEEDDSDDDWLSSATEDSDDADAEEDDWLNAAVDDESGDDDWLDAAVDDQADSADDDWLSSATADDSDDAWLEDASGDTSSALDEDYELDEEQDEGQEASQPLATVVEKLSLEDRAAAGGWYYENYYLRYRPSGHADRLIVAWIERLAANSNSELISKQLGQTMRVGLLGDNTPGSCLKCHSVDGADDPTEAVVVNWLGDKTSPSNHDFNAFKHQSHFSIIDGSSDDFAADQMGGCKSCHQLDDNSDSGLAYEDGATEHQGDFHNLQAEQCSSCHSAEPALANCTQCHNYHIGERGLAGIEDSSENVVRSEKQ